MTAPTDDEIRRVIDYLIYLHDCCDPDIGIPCAWHAGEKSRALDVACEERNMEPISLLREAAAGWEPGPGRQ